MSALSPILLLADDDPGDVELTLEAFAQHNVAHEIVVVHDGAEALDYLHRKGKHENRNNGDPALVLLDIKMPKADGLEVLRAIKSDDGLKAIPVVMWTSSRRELDLVRSYQLGVNAYVVKPVNFTQFTECIKQLALFWAVINEPPIRSKK